MPTYIQGTFIPLMSQPICASTDPSCTGRLFRFQLSVAYSWGAGEVGVIMAFTGWRGERRSEGGSGEEGEERERKRRRGHGETGMILGVSSMQQSTLLFNKGLIN